MVQAVTLSRLTPSNKPAQVGLPAGNGAFKCQRLWGDVYHSPWSRLPSPTPDLQGIFIISMELPMETLIQSGPTTL